MRFPDKSSFQFDIDYTFFTALRASSRDQPSHHLHNLWMSGDLSV
jgi:hypothetical protein